MSDLFGEPESVPYQRRTTRTKPSDKPDDREPIGEGKICGGCKTFFPYDEFSWNDHGSGRRYRCSRCKACKAKASREWNAKHSRGKLLNGNLVKAFGITLDDFNAMLTAQNGVCYICGLPPENSNQRNWRLHVDHCHECGAVRKLLCANCNNGLGCFRDNPELLHKAIEYLSKHTHV